jgi:hypothetical protein
MRLLIKYQLLKSTLFELNNFLYSYDILFGLHIKKFSFFIASRFSADTLNKVVNEFVLFKELVKKTNVLLVLVS